jgi:predicted RNA-binding protein YlxR (DUF448 family)
VVELGDTVSREAPAPDFVVGLYAPVAAPGLSRSASAFVLRMIAAIGASLDQALLQHGRGGWIARPAACENPLRTCILTRNQEVPGRSLSRLLLSSISPGARIDEPLKLRRGQYAAKSRVRTNQIAFEILLHRMCDPADHPGNTQQSRLLRPQAELAL